MEHSAHIAKWLRLWTATPGALVRLQLCALKNIAPWLNGRAPDSDSGGVGSIPAGAVVKAF